VIDERDAELNLFFLRHGALRPTVPVEESPAFDGLLRVDALLVRLMTHIAFARGYDQVCLDSQLVLVPQLERDCWDSLSAETHRMLRGRVGTCLN
jgi:hypothetical protein